MERPSFEKIKSYEEYAKYYWYLDELKSICKSLNIEYNGGKSELNKIIQAYFDGIIIPHKAKTKYKRETENITLDSSLIECGFNFGQKFRDFFIEQTGDKNFKFTADMAATAKHVKNNHNSEFTLGNLLDIKLGKTTYIKYDNSSCEWNKFYKDFCNDIYYNQYADKMKVASKFWKLLRNSDLPKIYTREFIIANKNKIENME